MRRRIPLSVPSSELTEIMTVLELLEIKRAVRRIASGKKTVLTAAGDAMEIRELKVGQTPHILWEIPDVSRGSFKVEQAYPLLYQLLRINTDAL